MAGPALGALHRRLAFSRSEVITVYGMMLVGATIVTSFTGHFLSVITGAMYYASPENDWKALFVEHQHPWVTPTDPRAVQFLYEGLPQGMAVPWSAWALTLAVWMPFMAAPLLGRLLPGGAAARPVDRERAAALSADEPAPGHDAGSG